MPGGLQPRYYRKIAEAVLGKSPSKEQKISPYGAPPRSTNINMDKIKADDSGVGDFVRGGVNGGF